MGSLLSRDMPKKKKAASSGKRRAPALQACGRAIANRETWLCAHHRSAIWNSLIMTDYYG